MKKIKKQVNDEIDIESKVRINIDKKYNKSNSKTTDYIIHINKRETHVSKNNAKKFKKMVYRRFDFLFKQKNGVESEMNNLKQNIEKLDFDDIEFNNVKELDRYLRNDIKKLGIDIKKRLQRINELVYDDDNEIYFEIGKYLNQVKEKIDEFKKNEVNEKLKEIVDLLDNKLKKKTMIIKGNELFHKYELLYKELKEKRDIIQSYYLNNHNTEDNRDSITSSNTNEMDEINELQKKVDYLSDEIKKLKTNAKKKCYKVYSKFIDQEFKKVTMKIVNKGTFTLYICPLTNQYMKNPYILVETNSTFEKSALEEYLKYNDKDPIYGKVLKSKQIIPNITLKEIISIKRENGEI